MTTSEHIGTIAKALSLAQAEFPVVRKGRTARVESKTGASYSYNYADLGDVLAAVLPVLSKHGLAVTQPPAGDMLVTRLMHESGEWIEATWPLGTFTDARAAGSALTYFRRYSLCGILGIAAEEDDDGQQAQAGAERSRRPRGSGRVAGPERGATTPIADTGQPAPAPDPGLDGSRRAMWRQLRRAFGPDAETVLHDMCRDLHVESSKDLTLEQVERIIASVADLGDYIIPPGPQEKLAPGEPVLTPEQLEGLSSR